MKLNIMQLSSFYYSNLQYQKKINGTNISKFIKTNKKIGNFLKSNILPFYNWIFFHSFYNLLLLLKLQSFLEKTISISNNFKYQNSRIHLIKARIEYFFFNSYFYKNCYVTILKIEKNISVPINQLQLIPCFRYILISKKKTFLKDLFSFVLLNKFNDCSLNFKKKKTMIILNMLYNFSHFYSKLKTYSSLNFYSTNLENLNLLSESYSSTFGLIYLITCKRKFYSKLLLIKFIKICLLKINFFRNLAIIQPNKKKLQVKLDPSFSNFLRSGNIKFFIFYKFANFDFKILPSKNRIPIYFFLEIYEMSSIIKKITKKNISKTNKNNNLIKNKNTNILQKLNRYILNRQVYLLEIHWSLKKKLLKKGIFFLFNKKWSIDCILIKESKDFYNEIFGIIFISQIEKIFQENYLDLWLSSFFIYSTYLNSGIVNIVCNSTSLHEINKKKNNNQDIKYQKNIKKKGQYKFIESLAAYSLFCFIFQLKDRHNGNILINLDNRLVHVDFGYILGYLPGNMKFEADSFKLSNEFMSKLSGKQTEKFEYFRELFLRGFITLKRNYPKLIVILRSFSFRNDFKYNINYRIKNFAKRFNLDNNDKELMKYCLRLIEDSIENWKTIQYDKYQLHASGIN
nr:phosphatidylinositol 4-kinase [Cryptomonas curvata]